MEVRYMICYWAINRTDPQNSLSTTLDVPLQTAGTLFWCAQLGLGTNCLSSTVIFSSLRMRF